MSHIGPFTVSGDSPGPPSCALELRHDGLGKHRLIRGRSEEVVRRKAEVQAADWDARWHVVEGRRREQAARLHGRRSADARRALAAARSDLKRQELVQVDSLLKFALAVYDPVDWTKLKEKGTFDEKRPEIAPLPAPADSRELPPEPQATDLAYLPALGILDRVLPARRARTIAGCRARFETDHARWAKIAEELRNADAESSRKHFEMVALRTEAHAFNVAAWELRRRDFLARKAATNDAVDAIRAAYLALVPDAVAEYCDLVLSQSQYPDCFPREFDLDYHAARSLLVVDNLLPAPADLPTLEAVHYVSSLDDFEEQHIPQSRADARYDEVLCKVALRTVHELFEADQAGALQTVVWNGVVSSPDRAGGSFTACVLSLRAHRDAFKTLHLAQVDPRSCLEAFECVAGERLHELDAVTPLVPLRPAPGRKPLPRECW
ncbi:MAG: restriction endonuclease [Thermoanaerobaculia bacterium]|nr:restriction endonuclease [Thermoanaerobaculia bacterium]